MLIRYFSCSYSMTNETDICSAEEKDQFPQAPKRKNTAVSDDSRRRVSISQVAIQADIQREKRKNSSLSNNSAVGSNNGDTASKGYINPTFDHSLAGNTEVFNI